MIRRTYPSALFAAISLLFALSATSFAQESKSTSNVSIKNFGQMDDRFFRGGQPKQDEYKELADLGIKTVIDLREDPEGYEKGSVEALGMHYVNIPMSDKDYPAATKIDEFLKLVDNPETGKFYVHCAGGRHRTGVMGAVYRFNHYGWNYDQVYAEMKKFVEDYAVSFHKVASAAAATSDGKH